MAHLRLAALQTAGTLGDVGANLAELTAAAEEAAAAGADVLVTPEMFVSGYAVEGRLDELASEEFLEPVQALARRLGVAIVLGGPERAVDGVFNAAWFVDGAGEVVAVYRKSHLFDEMDRRLFVAGEQPFAMVEHRGVRIALMICYDVEFPEVVRAAALAGAHLVVVPTAQMRPFEFVAESVVRTRAWENQVYLAYVNHDGSEGDLEYVGRSSIVAPDATVLDSVVHGTRILYADVDAAEVERLQRENPYLTDRRAALYAVLAQAPPPRHAPDG
jgi:5-aminopentanamidase